MGSMLSAFNNNPEQANLKDEITEIDEFHDAVAEIDTPDKMDLPNSEYHELVTDAVESKFSHIFVNTSKITYETVADIESELDYYEKVALVFLLYEQPDSALQSLLVEYENIKHGSSTNLVYNWAKSKHISISSWQDRFVEALCVIQNYDLLRRFGFDKDEIKERFLPSQPYVSLHLNKIMKALYCVCEQLSDETFNILLTHLIADFKKKGLSFQDFDDLSNLIAILKNMKLSKEADWLETVMHMNTGDSQESISNIYNTVPKTSEKQDNVNKKHCNFDLTKPTENYANPTERSCSDNSVIGDNSIVRNIPSSDSYHIDPEHVGICLIINQKKFYKDDKTGLSFDESLQYLEVPKHNLHERDGTDKDKESLSEIFKKLGFRIIVRENLNHREMIPTIEEVMRTFTKKDSCFVVCILSHGVENKIYAANSVPVSIHKIRDSLHDRNYSTLLGKPKIIIIQSCQGTEIQKVILPTSDNNVTDGPSESNDADLNLINDETGVPEKRDLILCMSTVSGFASVRNKTEGTWYIQELCKTIDEKCETDHFQDMLTMVSDKVSNRRWEKKDKGIVCTMVPESTTTLSKKLYLRKIKKSS